MANLSNLNNNSSLTSFNHSLSSTLYGTPGDGVVGFYRDFRQQMLDLITNLQDQNAPLTLENKTLSAASKNSSAGQLLINDWLDNEQTTMSSMMDVLKFMQTMEKQAEGFSGT